MDRKFIYGLIFILSISVSVWSQTYIVPDLQRDDFKTAKTWWIFQNAGGQEDPSVNNGYLHAQLVDALDDAAGGPMTYRGENMENVGIMTANQREIYNKDMIMDLTIRVKTLNTLLPGSRGWGFWRSEDLPITQNQATWFMEQVADPNESFSSSWAAEETWWLSRVHNGIAPEDEYNTDLTALDPAVDNREWHTYRVLRYARQYYELYVDGALVQRTDAADLPNGALAGKYTFNCWNDNLVYHNTTNSISGNDTIEVYYNGWLGTSEFVVDFIEILKDEYNPSYSIAPSGSILLREVPGEIDDGISNGLWKSYTFDSPGDNCVIIATAKAEHYDGYDDDDDLKIVLNSRDFGYNTDRSWDGTTDDGIAKTIVIDTTLSSGSHTLSFYSEVTPILYDATVLGSSGGSLVLDQTVNESAPEGSENYLWKTYNFSCDPGEVAIYISGSADEEPGWDHQNTNIDSTDDDELRVMLDDTDYGWESDSSFVGNSMFGDSKTILITENVGGGSHTLKLYANESPTVYRVLVYAQNGDYSLPVELSTFSAQRLDDRTKLSWVTESEVENLGFNIFRAVSDDSLQPEQSQFAKINSRLIAGNGNSSQRNDYEYTDIFNPDAQYLWYMLQDVSYNGRTEFHNSLMINLAAEENDITPVEFRLRQNYPNPFNPNTVISYNLADNSPVELTIYNVLGNKIKTLVAGYQPAGQHRIQWNATDEQGNKVASGIYFYQLSTPAFMKIKKMTLLR